MGYRESDGDEGEYIRRMAGMMRVYFSILWTPVRQKLSAYYGSTRYWEWFSRLLSPGNEELLESAAAAEIIYGMFYWLFRSLF
jgi:GLE1-like protein